MKNKILLLCKRLDKFNIDDIETISEIEAAELLPILDELVSENKLVLRNGVYFYLRKPETKKPTIFEHYSKENIDLIIRCFCSNLPTITAANIVGSNDGSIGKFYQIFREAIFKRQEQELKNLFSNDPQHSRNRMFFEQEVYFYTYNNIIYVSDKVLDSDNKRFLTAEENKEFKKVYCYISRITSHNQNKHFLTHKIAEAIWRRNKSFDELYYEINKLTFMQFA